jgi:uncharacterized protein
VLRGGSEAEHYDWVQSAGSYYTRLLQRQNRQYAVKWLAIYFPAALRKPGAVTRLAQVQAIDVVPRRQIPTPWQTSRNLDELQVTYRLGAFVDLPRPIENRGLDGEAARFSTNRWTSRLALERARDVKELLLETEPEWRLYEELTSNGIEFEVTAGTPMLEKPEDPRGRAWFRIARKSVQFRGAEGFVIRDPATGDRRCAQIGQVIDLCR